MLSLLAKTDFRSKIYVFFGSLAETCKELLLRNVCPNPLNISCALPLTLGKTSLVKLALFVINGSLAKVIENGIMPAGEYRVAVDCRELSSGVYFLSSQAYGGIQNQKLIILK